MDAHTGVVSNVQHMNITLSKADEVASLWTRMSEIHVRPLMLSGKNQVAEQLCHPEHSELDADEFEKHFHNVFDEALHAAPGAVQQKFAKLANMSVGHRVHALANLRRLRNRLVSNLLPICNGNIWKYSDDCLKSINGDFSELSGVMKVRASQQRAFNAMSKATIALHYARTLRTVQDRMRT
jgi:hypothetical protein